MAVKQVKSWSGKGVIVILLLGLCAALALACLPFIEKEFYPYLYRDIIEKNAAIYGVDPLLVAAVIREESRFRADAESRQGAKGLMQIMPSTAFFIAESLNDQTYDEKYLFDPERNIQYGTWYLADLQKVFANNIALIAAAYNAGRGQVQEWISDNRIDPDDIQLEVIPFDETRIFVERVLKSYEKYKKLY